MPRSLERLVLSSAKTTRIVMGSSYEGPTKRMGVAVKLKRIVAVSVLVTLFLAISGRAEASPKLHFLKSKKFWHTAAVMVVPTAASSVLATWPTARGTFPKIPNGPAVTPAQPKQPH